MSRTAKYSRISELFTEGSHHRNLSVMAIDICTLTKTRPWDEIVTIWSCLITLWTYSKSWLCFNRCIPKYLLRHFKEALRISTNRPETDYDRRRLSSYEIKQDRKRRQGSNQIGSVTLIPMPGKASNGMISLIQHIYEAVLRFHLGPVVKGL